MKEEKDLRVDGWANIYTRQGTTQDKKTYTRYTAKNLLSESEVNDLFTDEGLGRKVVTKPVDAMIRSWFSVNGDKDDIDSNIQAIFDELKLRKPIKELLYLNKAFGGALMFLGLDDGEEDTGKPVNYNTLKSIKFITIYDRFRIPMINYNKDENSENYLNPETYSISPLEGKPFSAHYTRCVVLDGIFITDFVRRLNNGWGASIYQTIYDQLRDVGDTFSSIGHIIDNFETSSISMKNLLPLILAGKEDIIKTRLDLMDLSRHVMNTILLDADEEVYNKHSSTLAGLPETLDRQMQYLSSVSGIPVTVLFGRSSAGMNATGENDIREWYDSVDEERKDTLQIVLEKLIRMCMLCKDYYFKGNEPEKWFIQFNSMYQMTANESADVKVKISTADANYINAGVLDPEIVLKKRFEGGKFNENLILTEEDLTGEKKEKENVKINVEE
ncbi:MAG: hypothetical protein A2V66_11900 [Ignavibacteria bacterium RBG_13_36_8]|nr:MAG: hypothetical protein A2V66_11900 [Ignavibacteria bacterium RBG_13_36_8]